LAAKKLPSTIEDIALVVSSSDKQRFELSPDRALIRARQGHSVEVLGDWISANPPPKLYHGTVERFLPAIMAQGLLPQKRHHVHLSPDMGTAESVGSRRGSAIVLEVDAEALAASGEPFLLSGNGVWLVAQVPPEYLQLIPNTET
jgi:putative RNA 2'-phosphotransferase